MSPGKRRTLDRGVAQLVYLAVLSVGLLVVVELAVSLDDFALATSSRKGFNPDDVTAFDFNGDDFLGDFSLKPGRFTPDVARLVLMTMRGDSCTCAAHLFALPSRTGVTSRGRSCT